MNIDKLKQAIEIINLMDDQPIKSSGINSFAIGESVIIRTYSAGVWFGTLSQKEGNEVILSKARRMWQWHAKKSISLSAVANYGVTESKSRFAPAVENIWLEAIEIIPVTEQAKKNLEDVEDAKAE